MSLNVHIFVLCSSFIGIQYNSCFLCYTSLLQVSSWLTSRRSMSGEFSFRNIQKFNKDEGITFNYTKKFIVCLVNVLLFIYIFQYKSFFVLGIQWHIIFCTSSAYKNSYLILVQHSALSKHYFFPLLHFSDHQYNPWYEDNLSYCANPCRAQAILLPTTDIVAFCLSKASCCP